MRRICRVGILIIVLCASFFSIGEAARSIPVLADDAELSEYLEECSRFISENESAMTELALEIMEYADRNAESFFTIQEYGITRLNEEAIVFAGSDHAELYPDLSELFFTIFCSYDYDENYVEFRQFAQINARQEKDSYADLCLIYTEERKDASWEHALILECNNGGYWYCTEIPYPAMYPLQTPE